MTLGRSDQLRSARVREPSVPAPIVLLPEGVVVVVELRSVAGVEPIVPRLDGVVVVVVLLELGPAPIEPLLDGVVVELELLLPVAGDCVVDIPEPLPELAPGVVVPGVTEPEPPELDPEVVAPVGELLLVSAVPGDAPEPDVWATAKPIDMAAVPAITALSNLEAFI